MNTNIKNINSSWELTDAEIDAMYDEYCVHESEINYDLGEYREEYEQRRASLIKCLQAEYEARQTELYNKYRRLNDLAQREWRAA